MSQRPDGVAAVSRMPLLMAALSVYSAVPGACAQFSGPGGG